MAGTFRIISWLSKRFCFASVRKHRRLLQWNRSSATFWRFKLSRWKNAFPARFQRGNCVDSCLHFAVSWNQIVGSDRDRHRDVLLCWAVSCLHQVPYTFKLRNNPGHFPSDRLARILREFKQLVCCSTRSVSDLGLVR